MENSNSFQPLTSTVYEPQQPSHSTMTEHAQTSHHSTTSKVKSTPTKDAMRNTNHQERY